LKKLQISPPEQLSLMLDIADSMPSPPAGGPDDSRSRRVQLGHETLVYRLRRARRRSIGFQIDDQGLTISAPRWVPLRDIEAAIAEKRRWIVKKQQEWHDWRSKRRLPNLRFVGGAALPYLGQQVVLRLGADLSATRRADSDLLLALPPEAGELKDRAVFQPDQCALFRLVALFGSFAVGLLHPRRPHPPQLALDPLFTAGHRLCRRARTGASARAQPQSAVLECRGAALARLRGGARRNPARRRGSAAAIAKESPDENSAHHAAGR
jgi:hypothetical protein